MDRDLQPLPWLRIPCSGLTHSALELLTWKRGRDLVLSLQNQQELVQTPGAAGVGNVSLGLLECQGNGLRECKYPLQAGFLGKCPHPQGLWGRGQWWPGSAGGWVGR